MLAPKQKLPVQVAEVDGVQVDNVNLPEASQNEVLEEFATDAASADHQNASLVGQRIRLRGSVHDLVRTHLFDAAVRRAERLSAVLLTLHDWRR